MKDLAGAVRRRLGASQRQVVDRTIVVGVDGSDNSANALRWAIESARLTGGDVHIVHAVELVLPTRSPGIPPDALDEARATLREKASEELEGWIGPIRGAGVPYRTHVADGPAADAILQIAKDQRARIIVVGRRGLGTFARLLLGSVSHRLVQESPIPVVVVPAPEEG